MLREIDGLFDDEGFTPSGVPNHESGQRRSLVQSYFDGIDWNDEN